MVLRFVRLVLGCGTSLRSGAGVLGLIGRIAGEDEAAPHPSTGRVWLMRLGLAALTRPLAIADDWIWIADHSIRSVDASAWSSSASARAPGREAGR